MLAHHFLDGSYIPTSPPKLASPDPMYSSLGLLCSQPPPLQEPEDDLRALAGNHWKLGLCGYYYGCLSWAEAARRLAPTPVGTFLVRDSEQSHYLYALSVQTRKGPTSCRIGYCDGAFRLDSAGRIADRMPRFDCVTDLVEHYVELTAFLERGALPLTPVWLDLNECNTRDAPVQLKRPLFKRLPRLEHLCVMNIVAHVRSRCGRTLTKEAVERDPGYRTLPGQLKIYAWNYLFPAECTLEYSWLE